MSRAGFQPRREPKTSDLLIRQKVEAMMRRVLREHGQVYALKADISTARRSKPPCPRNPHDR